jgi:hypothetical protein
VSPLALDIGELDTHLITNCLLFVDVPIELYVDSRRNAVSSWVKAVTDRSGLVYAAPGIVRWQNGTIREWANLVVGSDRE